MGTRGNFRRREAMRRRLAAQEGGDECWLCGRPLDPSIPTPDPMSVEIDEIVPVALGGDPLDDANCRLVHRACNLRKGCRVLPQGAFAPKGGPRPRPRPSRNW